MKKEKIVITGYGIKAPGGYNVDHFTDSLITQVSALELFAGQGTEGKDIAFGVVYDKLEEIKKDKKYRRYPRISLLAMSAMKEAIQMAGKTDLSGYRTGIFMGTALGGTLGYDEVITIANENNFKAIPVTGCGIVHYHSLASSMAELLGITGVTRTVATGCSAGIDAIQDAMMYLHAGELDTCIVGGADAPISKSVMYAFGKIRCLSQNKELHAMGVPFSKKSAGFVIAEGASVLVLEKESAALNRGAKILAVIDEVSTTNDATGIFFSDSEGKHILHDMKRVTKDRRPTYVNSQALGMVENDRIEATNHMQLFGTDIPITSIKSITGHMFGASAGAQMIASLIGMEHNFIPGTVNAVRDDYPELPIVFDTTQTEVDRVVVTSHGYGGNNAAICISKY
ncbi:3-oxoacyl-[acyl-carrier-protein] synthase II [Aneurinibacillus soli]|uniref:Actinorhodin polyketide putative beta-ketoacyl synthase 1 n=1 Tax=Aneurinibacillus soli TaxID=1500254 RepID=A0A0U5AZS3_9BACL|nr:beta-ketoacyl synthase N-terminal-like domain-containing protein [Aneurinibacillus soli]PYE61393.1 3-oxoacyl-[acyl-carrier-protein] synthase II [Aneurinibacillus soli]BAU27778.1 Actinorhodin polyketide putative beta-ketoacyl synthase 1 [Aneurinibacillus soli]